MPVEEGPTREIWREFVICSMLTMSEEDRDWVRTQILGKNEKWVRVQDSDRMRALLPRAAPDRELPAGTPKVTPPASDAPAKP
jgi:hypothetical protein